MKATEQYFPVVLFTVLYEVILTFESVDEILECDLSNRNATELYFPRAFPCAVQDSSSRLNLLTCHYSNTSA